MEFLNAYSDSDDDDDDVMEEGVPSEKVKQELERPPISLPSASSAFSSVPEDSVPDFLNPEARRQFATQHPGPSSRSLAPNQGGHGKLDHASSTGQDNQHGRQKVKKQQPGPDFDISRLAPPLKGSKRDNGGSSVIDIRGQVNPDAVIEGRAKRYKQEEHAGPQISLAQIAMLGGKMPNSRAAAGTGGGAASKALPVDEFLVGKGGNAQMPRKGQDRRDREKEKRAKGQSAIGSWKSEAEMVLRQQFDS